VKEKPNLPIAFASVLLSVMLWFVVYVQNVPEPIPLRATLALDGVNETKFFVRKVPSDIRLDVAMTAEKAKELGDQQVTASVDLSDPKEGTNEYPVAISPSWVVGFLSGSRPTARITIEKTDRHSLPVRIIVMGALSDPKLRLNETRALPPKVMVSGPATEVGMVRELRAYLDLSQIDVHHNEYQQIDVVPIDANGVRPQHLKVSPEAVVASVSFGPSPSTKVASVVPDLADVSYDTTVVKANGYALEPDTVVLSGNPAVLANVSKVPTEIVHANGLKADRTLSIRLIAPAGTQIVGSDRVRLTLRTLPAPKPRTEILPTKKAPSKKMVPAYPSEVPPLNP